MAGSPQPTRALFFFYILLQQLVRLLVKTAALKSQSGEIRARDLSK